MAQKLTEQEHDAIVSLAKLLSKELPVQQRSVSGGIASGLVRLRKNPLGREDVMGVLSRYGAGEPTLKDLLDLQTFHIFCKPLCIFYHNTAFSVRTPNLCIFNPRQIPP